MFDQPLKLIGIKPICLLCDGRVATTSGNAIPICQGCQADLPWLTNHCQHCALPLASNYDYAYCGECLQSPPPWQRCLAAFEYRYPVDQLITQLKQHGNHTAGRILAELFCDQIVAYLDSPPDLLIPVPLHWSSQLQRGFNQSIELTKPLSRLLNIPCNHQLISKQVRTKTQHLLTRKERERNLKTAFQVNEQLSGYQVALVDDVMTTGSTARILTQQLLKAGARSVEVWSVARTPKE